MGGKKCNQYTLVRVIFPGQAWPSSQTILVVKGEWPGVGPGSAERRLRVCLPNIMFCQVGFNTTSGELWRVICSRKKCQRMDSDRDNFGSQVMPTLLSVQTVEKCIVIRGI